MRNVGVHRHLVSREIVVDEEADALVDGQFLHDDPVGREVRVGRAQAYQALLDSIKGDDTIAAEVIRKEYEAVIAQNTAATEESSGGSLRLRAIAAARERELELRNDDVIGDDVYRVLVQELDWAELSAGGG
mgnify:CR=1 FL=1